MTIEELIELLIEDPFDDRARSQLASLYFNQGELQKASKQYALIQKQRKLDNIEQVLFDGCGVDAVVSAPSENNKPPKDEIIAPLLKDGPQVLTLVSDNVEPIRRNTYEKIRFDDIRGLDSVKRLLSLQIIEPFKNPEIFKKYGKKAGGGVLLYGPPGCGKTMLARAIATECNAAFIKVGISDILNQYVGGSEHNLSAIFDKARADKPCVLFFDELDALAFARSKSQSDYSRTLVNEFLNQLDGMGNDNEDILFLSATNMPWDVDSAMKRPGRFSRLIFIPPPEEETRLKMLEAKLDGLPSSALNLREINLKLKNFSGADIDGLVEQLREITVERYIESGKEHDLSMKDVKSIMINLTASTEDWLSTARNVVKYAGSDKTYQGVEFYLKANKLL